MKYGCFNNKSGGFEINIPRTPTPWKMPLFNDNYVTFIDQMLLGKSLAVEPINHTTKVISPGNREFWLRDRQSGKVLQLNGSKDERNYKLTHYLDRIELERTFEDITVNVCVFVPTEDQKEYWKIAVKNNSDLSREVSLFSHIGFMEYSPYMGGDCRRIGNAIVKYTFPAHTFYEDKEKCDNRDEYYYLLSDTSPDSCDMSEYNFRGGYLTDSVPLSVANDCCSDIDGEVEDFCAVMQHIMKLKSGETKTVCFEVGVTNGKEKIADFEKTFTLQFVENELLKTKKHWCSISDTNTVCTPNADFNEFTNLWVKKQIVYLTRTNRLGNYCPKRNQLQDAMGYSLFEPQKAKEYMYKVFATQRSDGYVKQWYFTNGNKDVGLALLEHCDAPIWVIVCGCVLVNQLGDASVLGDRIPYCDGGDATLLEHLIAALRYISRDVGEHGICLMRDGDWTDPINGIGRKGKGESAWTSMGVMYAAKLLKELLADIGDTNYINEVSQIWETTDRVVNSVLWQGDRYIGGFDDDGIPYADRSDSDRVLLNVQTWALLSGAARGERAQAVKDTIKKITCEFGPYTIYPGFDKWNAQWGRISLKKNGTTENGAVYCHAALFKAFSDTALSDGDAMFDTLLRVTPLNPDNPVEINRQLPLFITNYYYSLKGSHNFGRSSCNYDTGSAAWFLLTVLEGLFGVKSTVNGLVLEPNIPQNWDNVSCARNYKGSTYNITFKRGASGIFVDGKSFDGKVLPYEQNKNYNIIYGLDKV